MLMHVSRDDGSARGQLTKQNFRYETPHLHGYVPSVLISAERPKEGSEEISRELIRNDQFFGWKARLKQIKSRWFPTYAP